MLIVALYLDRISSSNKISANINPIRAISSTIGVSEMVDFLFYSVSVNILLLFVWNKISGSILSSKYKQKEHSKSKTFLAFPLGPDRIYTFRPGVFPLLNVIWELNHLYLFLPNIFSVFSRKTFRYLIICRFRRLHLTLIAFQRIN